MNEHNFDTNEQTGSPGLDERLRVYYGPQLREQPLSQATWQRLHLQLGAQEGTQSEYRSQRHPVQRRSRAYVPPFIEQAFARIVFEAHIPSTQVTLRCPSKPRRREPAVHVSWPGRHNIRLLLPANALISMGQAELDVLLATGLARSVAARKPAYRLGQLLLVVLLILACVALTLFWLRHMPFVGFPVALLLCAIVAWLWHIQARFLAFYADRLIVQWLGRGRACRGLHALADRSRTPERKRWGEPSLEERIERVCGSRVESKGNELTLVG